MITYYVDDARCTGCGVCVTACPVQAIRLEDGVARIDTQTCRARGACTDACPRHAILSVSEQPEPEPAALTRVERPRVQVAYQPAATPSLAARALPVVGAALAFVGREVVPRVGGVLLDTWSRQPEASAPPTAGVPYAANPQPPIAGRRRRARHRGGCV